MDPEGPVLSQDELGLPEAPGDRADAAVVQGITTEHLAANEDPISEAQGLYDDFKKLDQMYGGNLMMKVPSKDGDVKLVFGRVNMAINGSDRRYTAGVDHDGLFLVEGPAAEEFYSRTRFGRKHTEGDDFESIVLNERDTNFTDGRGSNQVDRVITDEQMKKWEATFTACKDRVESSVVGQPMVHKARSMVRNAIAEARPATSKAA